MTSPLSDSELQVIINEEIAALDNLTRPTWKKHRIKVETQPAERDGGDKTQLYTVARSGTEVVVYDPHEKNFATGVLDEDNVLRRWTSYGDALRDALRHFPKHSRPSKSEAES